MKKRKVKNRRKKIITTQKELNEDWRQELTEIAEEANGWVPDDKKISALLSDLVKEQAPKVTCGNCTYKWTPDPRRWRDDPEDLHLIEFKGELARPIICPACNTKNKMDLKTVFWIVDWWKRYKMIEKAFREEAKTVRKKFSVLT